MAFEKLVHLTAQDLMIQASIEAEAGRELLLEGDLDEGERRLNNVKEIIRKVRAVNQIPSRLSQRFIDLGLRPPGEEFFARFAPNSQPLTDNLVDSTGILHLQPVDERETPQQIVNPLVGSPVDIVEPALRLPVVVAEPPTANNVVLGQSVDSVVLEPTKKTPRGKGDLSVQQEQVVRLLLEVDEYGDLKNKGLSQVAEKLFPDMYNDVPEALVTRRKAIENKKIEEIIAARKRAVEKIARAVKFPQDAQPYIRELLDWINSQDRYKGLNFDQIIAILKREKFSVGSKSFKK